MLKLIYRIAFIILLFVLNSSDSAHFIEEFNSRLGQFETCNTRVIADFMNTEFEPFLVPISLTNRENRTIWKENLLIWGIEGFRTKQHYEFKYRTSPCKFELIIYLDELPPSRKSNMYQRAYQMYMGMEDTYLVYIREHARFKSENNDWIWGLSARLSGHRVLVWTVKHLDSSNDLFGHADHLGFQGLFFLCKACQMDVDGSICKVHVFEDASQNSEPRSQMDSFVTRSRKTLFWRTPATLSYRKLSRHKQLPYDEQNLKQQPSSDFHKFIQGLLDQSNGSIKIDILSVQFVNFYSKHLITMRSGVADETDDFNFITCHTSDTFWSVVELFQRPFQPMVWLCLGFILLISGILIVALKMFLNLRFSGWKFFTSVVLNLIEVDVAPGNMSGHKAALTLFLATWFLMGIILTNSYKGLIIAYLSVPWEPEQDYNSFEQLTGFKVYSRVPHIKDEEYWESCALSAAYMKSLNLSCNHYSTITVLGEYVNLNEARLRESNDSVFWVLHKMLSFPNNESSEVFNKLISKGNVAIAGSNSEIDEILLDFKSEFPGHRVFRGKENLWSHQAYWTFLRISFSQPRFELVQLMQSGVYQFWKYWLRDRKYLESKLKDEHKASPKPLTLSSNATFVFVILIIGLLISVGTFFGEILYMSLKFKLHTELKLSFRSSVMCRIPTRFCST